MFARDSLVKLTMVNTQCSEFPRTPLRRSSEKPPVQTAHYRRRGIPISTSIIRSPIWGSGHTRPWGIGVGRSEGLEPPDWVPSREGGCGGIAPLLDRALLDLGYLVGHKTVRLAVHGLGRLLVRGVRPVGVCDRLSGQPLHAPVVVNEQRHKPIASFPGLLLGDHRALHCEHDAPRASVVHPHTRYPSDYLVELLRITLLRRWVNKGKSGD